MTMHIVNLTPHIIRLNDGTEFPPSGAEQASRGLGLAQDAMAAAFEALGL